VRKESTGDVRAGVEMSAAIEVRELSYRYPGGRLALSSISFSVKEGECLAVLGPMARQVDVAPASQRAAPGTLFIPACDIRAR